MRLDKEWGIWISYEWYYAWTKICWWEFIFVSESEKNKWLFGFKNYQNGLNWKDMMNGRRELCHGMIIRDRKMVNGEYGWGNGVVKAHESWIDDGFRVSVKRVFWKNKEKVICLEWANFL